MNTEDANDTLELRLTRALDNKPEVAIPAGFAARIASQVAERSEVAVVPARFGLLAARIGMVLLFLALLALAMRAPGHSVLTVTMEWVLCAELAGIAVWYGGVGNFGPQR
jgi:hypothetical protein